jgi:transcriptional regulator with XRE-family HTH domain
VSWDSLLRRPYASLQIGRFRAAGLDQAKEGEGMPAKRKEDDGPVTGVQAFAAELRAQREAAGLTQAQLAKLMGYSESVIAKLETCRTIPSPQHAAQADAALRTPGTFRRLRQMMLNGANEPWVRAFLDMEERATVLLWWEALLVPGLLQTEAYARGVIRGARPTDTEAAIDQLVTARMARQEIWERVDPEPQCCRSSWVRRYCGSGLVVRA